MGGKARPDAALAGVRARNVPADVRDRRRRRRTHRGHAPEHGSSGRRHARLHPRRHCDRLRADRGRAGRAGALGSRPRAAPSLARAEQAPRGRRPASRRGRSAGRQGLRRPGRGRQPVRLESYGRARVTSSTRGDAERPPGRWVWLHGRFRRCGRRPAPCRDPGWRLRRHRRCAEARQERRGRRARRQARLPHVSAAPVPGRHRASRPVGGRTRSAASSTSRTTSACTRTR